MKDFNKQTRLTKSNVIPESCSRGSVVYRTNRFSTETLGNDASMGAGLLTKGFTLIELLVVVLIIGILAAVALPQYQTAVDKARYGKIIPMTRTLKDAAEVYYMANGSYPSRIDMIDVTGPSDCSFPAGDNIVLCPEAWYDILNGGSLNVSGYTYPRYNTPANVLRAGYRIWLDQSGDIAGRRECVATDDRTHRLCKAMGGVRQGTSSVYTLP